MVELLKKTEVSSGVMNAMVCIVEKTQCRVYLVSLEQCIDADLCARTQFLTAMRPQGIDSLTGVESTGADAGRTLTACLNLFEFICDYLRLFSCFMVSNSWYLLSFLKVVCKRLNLLSYLPIDKQDLMVILYVWKQNGGRTPSDRTTRRLL
jgi:hypothetical protein